MTLPPYLDADPANFIESEGQYVYVLAGIATLSDPSLPDSPIQLLLGDDVIFEYEAVMLPIFEFFKVPREEYQVQEWIEWSNEGDGLLQALMVNKIILKIDTTSPQSTLESLTGLRLVPNCLPIGTDPDDPYTVFASQNAEDGSYIPINIALSDCLGRWEESRDLPSYVEDVAEEMEISDEHVTRKILEDVPFLLSHGYVYLEWLEIPEALPVVLAEA